MYVSKRLIWFAVLAAVLFPILWVTVLAPAIFILLSGAQH